MSRKDRRQKRRQRLKIAKAVVQMLRHLVKVGDVAASKVWIRADGMINFLQRFRSPVELYREYQDLAFKRGVLVQI